MYKIKFIILTIFFIGLFPSFSYAGDSQHTSSEKAIYHPLTLIEFGRTPTFMKFWNIVNNPMNDPEFLNSCIVQLKKDGCILGLDEFKSYLANRANMLYGREAPLTLKFPVQYKYLGKWEYLGKSVFLCINLELYESIMVSLNVATHIQFEVTNEMAQDLVEDVEKRYGLKTSGINLYGTNRLKDEHFADSNQFMAHTIIGQTLALTGSIGEVMQKAVTLDNLKVKELSCFPGYLLTPPKQDCHGGAIVLIPSTGNIDQELIGNALWLTEQGFVTFVVETFYGNNISGRLNNPLESPMQNEVITAYRARQILSSHPYVNKDLIGVGGFSRGATVADLTSREEFYAVHSHDGKPFAFEYGYYPSIILQQLELRVSPSPKLYLTGDQDPFVDVKTTQNYMDRLKAANIDAELKVYEGATHSFDALSYWEDTEFPIVANDKVNFFYDASGFIPANEMGKGIKQPWNDLSEYLMVRIKFGYKQVPNPSATEQAKKDLMTWFTNTVKIPFQQSNGGGNSL